MIGRVGFTPSDEYPSMPWEHHCGDVRAAANLYRVVFVRHVQIEGVVVKTLDPGINVMSPSIDLGVDLDRQRESVVLSRETGDHRADVLAQQSCDGVGSG